jgi:hypothetical protein
VSLVLLGPLRNAFMSNAMRGFALAQKANPAIGNFNALRDLGLSDKKSVIELSNLKHLERTLREVSPKMLRDFKRDARKVGDPAKKAIRQAFADAGTLVRLAIKKDEAVITTEWILLFWDTSVGTTLKLLQGVEA